MVSGRMDSNDLEAVRRGALARVYELLLDLAKNKEMNDQRAKTNKESMSKFEPEYSDNGIDEK